MATIEAGSIIAGKYHVERQLSKGGMGSLWVARQLQLQRLVVIKLMEPSLAATAQDWLSCASVGHVFREELGIQSAGSFTGFSPLMKELDQVFKAKPLAPFSEEGDYSPFYRRLYEAYL